MTTTTTTPSSSTPSDTDQFVISVRNLRKYFPIREGVMQRATGNVKAVDGVTIDVRRGETVGLVGESGCGKTTLGRVISGLADPTEGGVYFGLDGPARRRLDELTPGSAEADQFDRDYRVDRMAPKQWRNYRRNCQVVFQDAFSSLNPRQLVKDIVGRPLKIYKEASGSQLTERVVTLLEQVGMGRQHLYRYPHQFSGGQRQRISIARALALEPEFIVLDEPTSALDVSVQAQILNLLHALQREHELTYLFISHDLNVVRHMSDRIFVMYLGEVAEAATAEELFSSPLHPYTEALLGANPSLANQSSEHQALEGSIPDPARPPQGCRFHTRCPVATAWCGWEIDDIVRQLGDSSFSELDNVERHSPFSGELSFESSEAAARLVANLQTSANPAMRDALETATTDGKTATIRFREVEPVWLEEVKPGHITNCVHHTSHPPT